MSGPGKAILGVLFVMFVVRVVGLGVSGRPGPDVEATIALGYRRGSTARIAP